LAPVSNSPRTSAPVPAAALPVPAGLDPGAATAAAVAAGRLAPLSPVPLAAELPPADPDADAWAKRLTFNVILPLNTGSASSPRCRSSHTAGRSRVGEGEVGCHARGRGAIAAERLRSELKPPPPSPPQRLTVRLSERLLGTEEESAGEGKGLRTRRWGVEGIASAARCT